MKVKRLISLVALLLIISTGLTGAELMVDDVEINPGIIWLQDEGSTLSIYTRCKSEGSSVSTANVTASIFPTDSGIPSISYLYYDATNDRYTLSGFSFPFSNAGRYKVNITCELNDETASYIGYINAWRLELDIIKEDDIIDAYMGDYTTLNVGFRVDDGESKKIIPPPQGTFRVNIGDNFDKVVDQNDIKIIGNQYQSITIEIPLNADDSNYLPEGVYDLEITGEYTEYGETSFVKKKERDFIRINPALKVSLPDEEIECIAGEVCEKEMDIKLVFPLGDVNDFSLDNIESMVVGKDAKGKKVYINEILCDEETNICKVSLDIPPTLDPGSYDLYITLAYPSISSYDYISKTSMPLKIVLKLSGEIKDASGGIIGTRFTLENKETGEITIQDTDSNGEYALNVLPGYYDFGLRFFDSGTGRFVTADFNDVRIYPDIKTLSSNFIRYDRDTINCEGPGIRIVKVVVLEFALPFNSARLYVPYDSSRVNGDEEDLVVYTCNRWNFKKRTCTGKWVEVDREIHTIQDSLEFNMNSSGAFVIGEKRILRISSVDIKNEKVYMNDPVNVVGKITDSDGEAVEGIGVMVSFPKFNISKSTLSGTGGLFSIDINAPYVEGPVDMDIAILNQESTGGKIKRSIDVLRKMELAIIGIPDMVDVEINEEATIGFKLFNSGQTNLTKPINIHISGISSDWYEILPLRVNGIPVGEQRDVEMKIKITPKLCGGACPKFSLVNVEAKSDEISKVMSFTLRISQPETPLNTTETRDEGNKLLSIPKITGFAISPPTLSFDNRYLYLTIIVVLMLLIVNKKKKKKRTIRAPVVSSLHRIKTGI